MRLIIDNARVSHSNGQTANKPKGLTKEQRKTLAQVALFAALLEGLLK